MIKTITYAGHSAILLNSESITIAIDPWLMGNPLCPEELINPAQIDLIILTHGHSDHAGDVLRLAEKYNCKVLATFELASLLAQDGIPQENLIYMNKGGQIDFEGYKISLTHAFHSNSYQSKQGLAYAGEACGVIIEDKENTFYHAGDTALFSDMKLIAELYSPDYVMLPIGDCFTMSPKHASIAAKFLNAKYVIPIHHSTFPLLTGKPNELKIYLEGSKIEVLEMSPGSSRII